MTLRTTQMGRFARIAMLSAVLGLYPALPAPAQIDLQSDLVVYLPFDGDYLDYSPEMNNASVGGGTPEFVSGLFGQAASFEYHAEPYEPEFVALRDEFHNPADFGEDLDFEEDTDFTIALWVNQPAAQSGDPAVISNKDWDSGSNPGWVFAISGSDWKVNQTGDEGPRADTAWNPIPENEWTMIAASFDRDGNITTYQGNVDGDGNEMFQEIDSKPISPGDVTALDVNIAQDGTGAYSWGANFAGMIDEVAIWRRALSADEVHAISYYGRIHDENLNTLTARTDFSDLPPLSEPPANAIIPISGDTNPTDPEHYVGISTNGQTVRYRVGVNTNVGTQGPLSGPGPFAVSAPVMTVYEGELRTEGQEDAYDRAMVVAVNGEGVTAPQAEGYQLAMGERTIEASGAQVLTGDAYPMENGLDAQLSYYFSDSEAIVRTTVELTNNTGAPIDAETLFANALGSWINTTIVATASGDETLDYYDRWIITDDADGSGSPTVTTVFHGLDTSTALHGLTSTGDSANVFGLLGPLTVDPSELPGGPSNSLNYMFFSQMSSSREDAIADVSQFDSLVSLGDAGLLEGITLWDTKFANWGWDGEPVLPPDPGLIPIGRKNPDPGQFLEILTHGGGVRYEVGVTTELNYDLGTYDHTGPAMTVYEGDFLDELGKVKQGDAYDRALIVAVNGEGVVAAKADAVTYDGTLDTEASGAQVLAGETYTMDNGLEAKLSYYFSDTDAIIRTIVELTNDPDNTNDLDANTLFANRLGSDADTAVVATASEDDELDPGDRWVITDDEDVLGDPTLTHVFYGAGADTTLASVDWEAPDPLYPGAYLDDLYGLMDTVTLGPGESTAFMFFSRMSPDRATAQAGTDVFESLGTLTAAGLLEGIIPQDMDFANWENVDLLNLNTVAPGNWNDAATWGGTVPTAQYTTTVGPHLVTVLANGEASSISIADADAHVTISAGNTLSVANGVQLSAGTLAVESTAVLSVGGDLAVAAGAEFVTQVGETAAGVIDVTGEADLAGTLKFEVTGEYPFQFGDYTLITAGSFSQPFESSEGLNKYVTPGDANDHLDYSAGALTVHIDYNLNDGDANLDTVTDVRDFNVWNANKFTGGTGWTGGDFTGDGVTDVRDFNRWNAAKFTSATGPGPPARLAEGQVPEPGTLALLACGLIALAIVRRRRRPL